MLALGWFMRQVRAGDGGCKSGVEAAQIGLHRFAVGPDRRLKRVGGNRQCPRAGDRTQHDCIDHGASFVGDCFEIEQ